MKIKTQVKAGGITRNHNQTVKPLKTKLTIKDLKRPRGSMSTKTNLRAGLIQKFSGGDVEGEVTTLP